MVTVTLASALCATIAIVCGIMLIRSDNQVCRFFGWFFIIFNTFMLLSGCAKDVPRDTVVPSGAVTVNVPVPTCGDDLAKTLFVTPTIRPATLPINQLSDADREDYERVSKAYMDTVEILTKYAVQMERDRAQAQQQCKATRDAVNTLNTKTPVIPAQK